MGFNRFQDIEKENERKLNEAKNKIWDSEASTFYSLIVTHEELKAILRGNCPYPQGDFKERLLKADLVQSQGRLIK